MKLYGKPTLFIAVEAGDGGGTASVEDFGVDYVTPKNNVELDSILSWLSTDTKYAGVVLDSATEAIARIIKPFALTFPSREKQAVRGLGVPDRGDYQSMGEFMRQRFNDLINITSKDFGKPETRKHLIVTARLREKYDENGTLLSIGPDLPGQMASNAIGMFQTVSRIDVKNVVVPNPMELGKTMRIQKRVLRTEPEAVSALGDRYRILPKELDLTTPEGGYVGFVEIWEQFWVPRFKQQQTTIGEKS
jgi:hypothetical protein